jgi:hypothetical protein
MSESQEPRAALVSVQDQGTINRILETNLGETTSTESIELLMVTQQVLSRVAQYSQPVREIQQVCNHPAEIADLRNQVTILRAQTQPAPLVCDHTNYETQLETLRNDLEVARRTPRTAGTDEDLRRELDDMTRDAREASEESRNLRTQLANALSLAARAAPPAPQQQEDRGQKFPDSPDFSGLDRTQLRGWIAQLRMVIRHTPSRFPDEQAKMRYAFNRLSGLALKQVLPHVRDNGDIGLEGLPAFVQLLEAAFGDPDRVATAERAMKEIKQKNREFSLYYAEFQVIAADLDWNPSALRNALRSGLSEEMKDSFIHTDMPDELPAFVTLCQKRDNQIRQRKAEKAAQHKWTPSAGSPSAPRAPAPPKAPEAAPAGTVAGYTGPAPMDLSAGRRRISDEERAKRFADGRCLYCGGFNHRAVDCAVRKKARPFKAAGAEVKEVGEKEDSEGKGKERVD